MEDYHNFHADFKAREEVIAWLKRDWGSWRPLYNVLPVTDRSDPQLATDIVSMLGVSSLSMLIDLTSNASGTCGISELLTVSANNWLSQTPIASVLQDFCKQHAGAACISSFVTTNHKWELPLEPARGQVVVVEGDNEYFSDESQTIEYKEWRKVFSVCHVGGNHWTLVIIDISMNDIVIYDPLNEETWVDMTRERCETILIPIVEDWRHRYADAMNYEYVKWKFWNWRILNGPTQSDGNSCGIFVLAVAWCYLFEGIQHPFIQHQGNVPVEESAIYRLRILWRCLCAPGTRPIVPPPPNTAAYARIEEQIKAQLNDVEK